MAVNLPAPRAESLLPVAGVELGVTMAGVRKPGRKDLSTDAFQKIMVDFEPITHALAPYMEKFAHG